MNWKIIIVNKYKLIFIDSISRNSDNSQNEGIQGLLEPIYKGSLNITKSNNFIYRK